MFLQRFVIDFFGLCCCGETEKKAGSKKAKYSFSPLKGCWLYFDLIRFVCLAMA